MFPAGSSAKKVGGARVHRDDFSANLKPFFRLHVSCVIASKHIFFVSPLLNRFLGPRLSTKKHQAKTTITTETLKVIDNTITRITAECIRAFEKLVRAEKNNVKKKKQVPFLASFRVPPRVGEQVPSSHLVSQGECVLASGADSIPRFFVRQPQPHAADFTVRWGAR